jgi:uncharacterized OB-fold protein
MQPKTRNGSKVISLDTRKLRAARCERCGAKIYPTSHLKPHLARHRARHRWLNAELKKLQFTFAHMRDIA